MKKNSLNSFDKTDLAPLECADSSPWRRLLKNPHFSVPADLPPSQRMRQRRALQQTRQSRSEQRMQEILQNTTPYEREILRKLGFKVKQALRQACLGRSQSNPNEPNQAHPREADQSIR